METVLISSTSASQRFSFQTQLAAEQMLGELLGNRLEVVLVPQKVRTNENGMIRVAVSKNPKWYCDFCSRFLKPTRKGYSKIHTNIKREPTIRALLHIVHGTEPKSEIYVLRLLPEIEIYSRKNQIPLACSNPF